MGHETVIILVLYDSLGEGLADSQPMKEIRACSVAQVVRSKPYCSVRLINILL